jgi:DNA/RNA non-specific endonuclease
MKNIKKLVISIVIMIVLIWTSIGEDANEMEFSFSREDLEAYTLIEVDGGDLSGDREANVVVDIGFGHREYYGFTNEYGQLAKVVAEEIILQDDKNEPVLSTGRYYHDEAKVPGVESKTLDEGHVIADSLGGVSNAYNITPQNSTLNRHGDQAYMEKTIRDAGGATNFMAIITYPDTKTQIPDHYSITYTVNGNVINDEFDNVNPDEHNSGLNFDEIIEIIMDIIND